MGARAFKNSITMLKTVDLLLRICHCHILSLHVTLFIF